VWERRRTTMAEVLNEKQVISKTDVSAEVRTYTSLSPDEIGQRGEELYQTRIRPTVEPGNKGKILAIDVDTGDYEIGEDDLETAKRLHAKRENANIYILRIGYPFFGYI
jgi:hypothetical protein